MNLTNITELCDIQIGRTPKRSEVKYWGQGHNWLSIADMDGKYVYDSKEQVTDLAVDECRMKIVPENTVIMSFKLTIGRLGITDKDLYTNEAIAAFLIKDKNLLLPEYLYYALEGYNFDHLTDRAAKGKTLNKRKLSKIYIPLLTIDKQKEVIDVLNKTENLREKRQQQIDALSALKQSVFLDMFGDPTINYMEFTRRKLKEISKITTGNTPPRKQLENYGDYIEWIKSDNIKDDNIYLTRATEYLSEVGANIGRVVPEGSLLVTCIAGSKSSIGKVAIVDRSVAFNQQINAITPSESILTEFLYVQLILLQSKIQSYSTNSMKGMINKRTFEQIEIIVPDIDLQTKFQEKFFEITTAQANLNKSLMELENLYSSTLYKSFYGELFKEEIKA